MNKNNNINPYDELISQKDLVVSNIRNAKYIVIERTRVVNVQVDIAKNSFYGLMTATRANECLSIVNNSPILKKNIEKLYKETYNEYVDLINKIQEDINVDNNFKNRLIELLNEEYIEFSNVFYNMNEKINEFVMMLNFSNSQ